MASGVHELRQAVLVVEDEEILRKLATEFVEDAGFEAIEAEAADEAVQILERRTDIRIVFTDINMPGRLDGIQLAASIRDRWPPIEIILNSGQDTPKSHELPSRAVFLPKPYQFTKVVEVLHEMVR
jgi:DNA-binding NtrC family response regulator